MFNFFHILYKKIMSSKISYSYGGIDALVANIFKDKRFGIYCDVGSSHPIKNNNTYLLHKKGWLGTNIDLDLKNIQLFNYARPKDNNVNAAVSDKVSEENLYFYHDKSPINTLSKEISAYQSANVSKIIKVKTVTLNSILDNSAFSDKPIDFLSIDVEGFEYNVLKNFNFDKYNPKVIVVEYLDTTLEELEIKNLNIDNVLKSPIYKFITSRGYTLANWLHSDLVFIRNDFRD